MLRPIREEHLASRDSIEPSELKVLEPASIDAFVQLASALDSASVFRHVSTCQNEPQTRRKGNPFS